MKKVWNFLKSMKFGMLLLILILVCSFAGSMIEQGNTAEFYQANYSAWSGALLWLQFDDMFSSWYFILLMGLLCLNLILCSILRLKSTIRQFGAAIEKAGKAHIEKKPDKEALMGLPALLKRRGFHKCKEGDGHRVYYKNRLGHYGSFVTHLGILLTLVMAGAAMWVAVVEDYTLAPGESVTLADNTKITLNSFRMTDESGSVDYVSELSVTDQHGKESGPSPISVNYPLSFGGHKYYQQSYATFGSLTIINEGKGETIVLDEQMFLSLDGEHGVAYYGLYPDHVTDGDGKITPVQNAAYVNPVYAVGIYNDEGESMGVVLPGETLEVEGVYYTFNEPVSVSGVRVKTVPLFVNGLLYASFAVLTIGLYLCFFLVPVYVKMEEGGYAIVSPKRAVDLENQILALTKVKTEDDKKC